MKFIKRLIHGLQYRRALRALERERQQSRVSIAEPVYGVADSSAVGVFLAAQGRTAAGRRELVFANGEQL
jgi:hypothetical protein